MIRIGLVDDQPIMIEGLKMIIPCDDMEVVATASNGQEAYEICKNQCLDVLLLDIKMPVCNGVEAVKMIKRDFDQVKVIMLTTFNDDEFIFDSLQNGASGYLLKDALPDDIRSAIRQVHAGGAIIEPASANRLLERFVELNTKEAVRSPQYNGLTKREREICLLIGEGKNNKEISGTLFISEGTVKNNITNILGKLELRDRTQLAIYMHKNNLLA